MQFGELQWFGSRWFGAEWCTVLGGLLQWDTVLSGAEPDVFHGSVVCAVVPGSSARRVALRASTGCAVRLDSVWCGSKRVQERRGEARRGDTR